VIWFSFLFKTIRLADATFKSPLYTDVHHHSMDEGREVMETLEPLTIGPRTLLSAVIGRTGAHTGKRRYLYDLLFSEHGSLLYLRFQRLYNDRVGGLVLYALGVRTVREMDRINRERRRRG
jgi:hypothetical protein